MIKVTIVVPNFNHAIYLPECLASIAKQTRPADEVILIDDGSTDHSIAVMSEFVANSPNARLIRHNETLGVVARLNEGMAAASHDWVAFTGADDVLDESFVETVSRYAEMHPQVGLVCGCATIIGKDHGILSRPILLPSASPKLIDPAQFRSLLNKIDNFILGQSTLYRRQALAELGGFDPALGPQTDGLVARRIASRHGMFFVPKTIASWRLHGGNYSVRSFTDKNAVDNLIAQTKAILESEPPGLFDEKYADLFVRRIRFGGARIMLLDQTASAATRAERIANLAQAGACTTKLLEWTIGLGSFGTFLVLAWLTLRLRPFSPLSIARLLWRKRTPPAMRA